MRDNICAGEFDRRESGSIRNERISDALYSAMWLKYRAEYDENYIREGQEKLKVRDKQIGKHFSGLLLPSGEQVRYNYFTIPDR
jgi:hypothetical protein